MAQAASKKDGHITWDDYRSWPDSERWEIIGGEAFAMSPSPGTRHQGILVELTTQLQLHFRGKACGVFAAPMDVKLSEADVVQPDLLVVCENDRIKPTHIEGAPTLVVEVLSPSTAFRDRGRKLKLYAASGVQEVWLVTPFPSSVEVLVLAGDSYRISGVYGKGDRMKSPAFAELEIDLREVFNFPLEPGELRVVKEGPAPYPYRRREVIKSDTVQEDEG